MLDAVSATLLLETDTAPAPAKGRTDERRDLARLIEPRPLSIARAYISPKPTARDDDPAFRLLDREEKLAILFSRRSSRLAAHAGSWVAAIDRRLPAIGAEAAEAQAVQGRMAALRRFAILYRLDRGGLAFEEEDRLAAAGFSPAQADVVRALVERFDESWAPAPSPWRRIATVAAAVILGTFLLDRWLQAGVDDPYVALLLAIVITTGIVSFFAVSAHPAGRPTHANARSRRK